MQYRQIVSAAFVAAAFGLQAADAVFPAASGDLAVNENWVDKDGNPIEHGETTDWVLSQKNGSYTIGSNSLRMLSLSWTKPGVIDLSENPDCKIYLGPNGGTYAGSKNAIFAGGTRSAGNNSWASACGRFEIKYGIWDCGGWTLQGTKGWNRGNGSSLVLSGAIVTNASSFQINYGGKNADACHGELTNGTRVYTQTGSTPVLQSCSRSSFTVSGGSQLHIGKSGHNWGLMSDCDDCTVRITGEGTLVSNACNLAESDSMNASSLIIDDKARIYLNSPYLGQDYNGGSASNLIRVASGAEYHVRGTAYWPFTQLGHENRFEVLDATCTFQGLELRGVSNSYVFANSTFTSGQINMLANSSYQTAEFLGGNLSLTNTTALQIQGLNNTVVLSNTTCDVRALNLVNATNCTLVLKGAETDYSFVNAAANYVFVGSVRDSRIVYDGSSAMRSGFYFASADSSFNTIELKNKSNMTSSYVRFQSYGGTTFGPTNNTLRVTDGSTLSTSCVYFRHANNGLVVSNATVMLTANGKSAISLISDMPSAEDLASGRLPTTNNVVCLQGRTPRVETTGDGTVYTRHGMIWRFEMPSDGFTTEQALVASQSWSSDGTAQFAFTGVAECLEGLTEARTYTLFETIDSTTKTPFNAAEFARMQAALPQVAGCTLVKNGNKIQLTLKPMRGVSIFVR